MSLFAFTFAAAALAGAAAAQDAAPQSVVVTGQRSASPWLRAESAHVVVLSDAPRADVARLIEHLEHLDALLRAYTAAYRTTAVDPGPKLNLVYLDSFDSLRRIRPDLSSMVVGLFTDCEGVTQSFLMHTAPLPAVADDKLVTAPMHRGLAHVAKAYARQFLYRHTDIRAPQAWVEGFAQFFAGAMFGARQMVVGRMPPGVADYFDLNDQGAIYLLDYSDVVAKDPFRKLQGWAMKEAAVGEFQAKSWALAHYVLGEGERRQRLGMFLNAVHRDGDAAAALRAAFGLDVDDAGRALWRYRLQAAKVLRVEMPEHMRMPPRIAFTTMSATSGQFVLADAVLKGCPARADGERLLRALRADAASVPNVDAGQLALSRAEVGWGDPAAALPWLRRAAGRDDASADVLVLLARAGLKLAERADAQARAAWLDEARASLARAHARAPESGPVALAALQLSLLADGVPSRVALDGVLDAWQAAHDASSLARVAALVWCYLGDTANAGHVLGMLAEDDRGPRSAAWAVAFRRRHDAGLAPAAIVDEMRNGATGEPLPPVGGE